jgi:hypothetical protein
VSDHDRIYYARRAAEEAELAENAADPSAAAAHRRLQRGYAERASVGEREPMQVPPDTIG